MAYALRNGRMGILSTTVAHLLQKVLNSCDVTLNGKRPWDVQIRDKRAYTRILCDGSVGFGESYVAGWWDVEDLDGLLDRLISSRLDRRLGLWRHIASTGHALFTNLQRPSRVADVARVHYNLGNSLYEGMLGQHMVYSCGYWEQARSLEQAQADKLRLVFTKLGLRPGMRVLDIGCGWGEALRMAAVDYGIIGTGLTISAEQAIYAQVLCAGLPIDIHLQDYRKLRGRYDRIFSIGMFEHVGPKNYRTYMQAIRRCLAEDGLFLLHTIGSNHDGHNADPWIEKYIFPNSGIPASQDISRAVQHLFIIEDWHNFGADYEPTLLVWRRNFDASWRGAGRSPSEQFYRMWVLYLSAMAAIFKARRAQVWQIVLSPHGVPGGYRRPALNLRTHRRAYRSEIPLR